MKILQVSPRYPPATGGIERHVRSLSERLAKRGHEVSVLTTTTGLRKEKEIQNDVKVQRIPAIAPKNEFHFTPLISPLVYFSSADIVHAHGYHSFPLVFATLGARNIPTVLTPHYLGSNSGVRGVLHKMYQPIGGRTLRSAKKVIAVSRWESNELSADFGIDPEIIPNGIDVEWFSAADPYDFGQPYILCASRLVENKGIQYVIDSLTKLPDYHLIITGEGPYKEQLSNRVREQGLQNKVMFFGYVSEDKLRSLYAGAECHILLSDFECYGLTPGESLAAGTPVVVYDQTALSDWKDHKGCVAVTERDPETVADAIRETSKKSVSVGKIERWEDVTDKIEKIYTEVNNHEVSSPH